MMVGMDMGNSMMMPGEETGAIAGFLEGLPRWASALLVTLAVLLLAALAGWIFGKLYASIRYPDPEKQQVLPPLVRAAFLCVLVGCSVWLFVTMFREEASEGDALPVDGAEPGMMQDGDYDVDYGGYAGGAVTMPAVEAPVAVMIG